MLSGKDFQRLSGGAVAAQSVLWDIRLWAGLCIGSTILFRLSPTTRRVLDRSHGLRPLLDHCSWRRIFFTLVEFGTELAVGSLCYKFSGNFRAVTDSRFGGMWQKTVVFNRSGFNSVLIPCAPFPQTLPLETKFCSQLTTSMKPSELFAVSLAEFIRRPLVNTFNYMWKRYRGTAVKSVKRHVVDCSMDALTYAGSCYLASKLCTKVGINQSSAYTFLVISLYGLTYGTYSVGRNLVLARCLPPQPELPEAAARTAALAPELLQLSEAAMGSCYRFATDCVNSLKVRQSVRAEAARLVHHLQVIAAARENNVDLPGDERDVLQRATTEQLQEYTQFFTYSKETEAKVGEQNQCNVCLEDYEHGSELAELTCAHIFHKACIANWLGQHNRCPSCRHNVHRPASENITTSFAGDPETMGLGADGGEGDAAAAQQQEDAPDELVAVQNLIKQWRKVHFPRAIEDSSWEEVRMYITLKNDPKYPEDITFMVNDQMDPRGATWPDFLITFWLNLGLGLTYDDETGCRD